MIKSPHIAESLTSEDDWATAARVTGLDSAARTSSAACVPVMVARPGLWPARSADVGQQSQRNGAGSMATDATASPRPARIGVSSPPKEWPMMAGRRSRPQMIVSKWSATCPIDLPANTSGRAAGAGLKAGSGFVAG
jgi:hypothetical protein